MQITGLPQIAFAHTFAADNYRTAFRPISQTAPFVEITYVAEGMLVCTFEDRASITVPQQSVFCNLYLAPVQITAPGHHVHHTVGFSIPFTPLDADADGALCLPLVMQTHEQSRIRALIDEIVLSHTMHTKGTLFGAGLLLQLLDTVDRRAREAAEVIPYHRRRYIKAAKAYIFDHLREPIRQADIADHLGISPEYLCAVFKSAEGLTVMQFINRIKLEQIRLLMENNGLTLAEASELYGYTDPNYVSRLHKKYFRYNITDKKRGHTENGVQTTARPEPIGGCLPR